MLVDRTLVGHGVPGTTQVPPYHTDWHVPPAVPAHVRPRRGQVDASSRPGTCSMGPRRLDKDGNPITLRLTWPDSEEESATDAQFIAGWLTELGITVEAAVTEEGKLLDDLLGPPDGDADWDFYMWGWVGDPDPMSLLSFFTSGQLGGLNDSFFSNERYDELFELQQRAVDQTERKGYITEMQEIFYEQAPYHVLYYDNELHAYRTDTFAGWINQPPENGTPLFGYGPIGYTKLTLAGEASPEPSTEAPTASGGTESPGTVRQWRRRRGARVQRRTTRRCSSAARWSSQPSWSAWSSCVDDRRRRTRTSRRPARRCTDDGPCLTGDALTGVAGRALLEASRGEGQLHRAAIWRPRRSRSS